MDRRTFLHNSVAAGALVGLSTVVDRMPCPIYGAEPPAAPGAHPNAWFADSIFNLLVDYYPEVAFRP